ncbi:MAG TPA: cell division protein ZipA C-terminal FtsZ-binding domain-containing protein [Pseudoduganella sp.]
MSLIIAGGVFVVGVFSYNKWQEYKLKKRVERAFDSQHDDVLMRTDDGVRAEPRFHLDDVPMPDAGSGAYGVPEHVGGHVGNVAAPNIMPDSNEPTLPVRTADADVPAEELATCLVDPLIDCLLPLELEAPARGEKLLPALQKLRFVGNKPVHFIGLAVSGDWEPVRHGVVYTKLQGGVQLASRSTALNELEYSELVTRLRSVSDEIGAEPQIPDMIEVMQDAKNLHRFVANHDAQLGVNLASNGAPWNIATLLGALEKLGFDVRPDGRYAMPDGEGGYLFSLSTNVTLAEETTSRLTLLLDVPCVAPARDGFGSMIGCAKSLMARLDATIVDDANQPLADETLASIAGQVREFYDDMAASDIPAGSTRALRLFS